jgi:hypothetical protein
MKLNLKDEPKEWRKSALLLLLAAAILSSIMRWRHHLAQPAWLAILTVLAVEAILAAAQPRLFRGYHLFSMRLGFALSKFFGRIFLTLFFIFIITPAGFLLRLAGKDPLQLNRPEKAGTYWKDAKECGPLDRMF